MQVSRIYVLSLSLSFSEPWAAAAAATAPPPPNLFFCMRAHGLPTEQSTMCASESKIEKKMLSSITSIFEIPVEDTGSVRVYAFAAVPYMCVAAQ